MVFRNGDRLIGRIKRMVRGKLALDCPALDGDAKIDRYRIKRMEGDRQFQFETRDGKNFLGNISDEEGLEDEVIVEVGGDRFGFPATEVLPIKPPRREMCPGLHLPRLVLELVTEE